MPPELFTVITTINSITEGVRCFTRMPGNRVVIVGDRRTPHWESTDCTTFLSLEDQRRGSDSLGRLAQESHYARKNIGYLHAMRRGATVIYETDDDNLPYGTWSFPENFSRRRYAGSDKYVNVYRHFLQSTIWPRGYPLDEVKRSSPVNVIDTAPIRIGVWQGLANEAPDVDAIFRLLFDEPVCFENKSPFAMPVGSYCPFNSQNTLWFAAAFPYLYLPVTVSSRWTDILRGYIAQRCLWEHGLHLGFTGPSVYQRRNPHDLMRDFSDEIPCYLDAKRVVETIDRLSLSDEPFQNLALVYEALVRQGLVDRAELDCVGAWTVDCVTAMSIDKRPLLQAA